MPRRRHVIGLAVAIPISVSAMILFAPIVSAGDCSGPEDCSAVADYVVVATGIAGGAAAVAVANAVRREKKSWIEIELVDRDGNPVPGETYQIRMPDGSTDEGTLDERGHARVDGIEPGTCEVCFPNIDASEWRSA